MRPLLLPIFFFTFLLLTSCEKKKEARSWAPTSEEILKFADDFVPEINITDDSTNTIDVSDYISDSQYSMSELVDTVMYVPLETKSESIIGEITKIKYFDDRFYILDKRVNKTLYIFDRSGRYINKVLRGEGPGMINMPYDFTIDEKLGFLYIIDGRLHKIMKFTLNGEFVSDKRVPYRFSNIRFVGDRYVTALTGDDNSHIPEISDYSVLVVDTAFKILSKGFKLSKQEARNDFYLEDHLRGQSHQAYYCPKFDNAIYKYVNDSSFSCRYKILLNDGLTADYRSMPSQEFFERTKRNGKYYFMGEYTETPGFVVLGLRSSSKPYVYVYYNKIKKTQIGGSRVKMDNENVPFYSGPISTMGDTLVSFVEAYNFMQPFLKKSKSKPVLDLIEKLDESSNPVITLTVLKK